MIILLQTFLFGHTPFGFGPLLFFEKQESYNNEERDDEDDEDEEDDENEDDLEERFFG